MQISEPYPENLHKGDRPQLLVQNRTAQSIRADEHSEES